MSFMDRRIEKAAILWLSGARLDDIRSLPEVQALIKRGAMVELEPSPITGSQAHNYAVMSGRSPASFGFFDTLIPRNYTVAENTTGRGPAPKMLPDMLRTVGWTVLYEETQATELVNCVQAWTRSPSAMAVPSCLVVKCSIGVEVPASALAQALRIIDEWVGETGLLAVLSDSRAATVNHFVNVNNFLAEMGVIERDEQNGQVNWTNSLAYFMGHGQLWINLLGRDAQGAVHPQDEYEEVRDTLVKAVPAKLRDAETGAPVIERIYRKEELYAGDYLFCAPDLVVQFKAGYAPSPRSARLDFDEAAITTLATPEITSAGIHPSLLSGFLLVAAPSLASDVSASEIVPLTAAVPTLLHALGIEYVDMASPAVSSLFLPAYLETHPVRSGLQDQEMSAEDEELIISHLRDLGYV